MLRFESVGDAIPFNVHERRGTVYNGVHKRIVAMQKRSILSINPEDGSHQVVMQCPEGRSFAFISCVDPRSGDLIIAVDTEFDYYDWWRISMDPQASHSELDVSQLNLAAWHMQLARLVCLNDGGWVVFARLPYDDEIGEEIEVGHYDSQWNLLVWSYGLDMHIFVNFDAFCSGAGCCFFRAGNALVRYNFQTQSFDFLAGCLSAGGCEDGVGGHARFSGLRQPKANSKYLFVRANGKTSWSWRLVRLDLTTLRAESILIVGVEHKDIWLLDVSEDFFYVLVQPPSTRPNELQLLRASLKEADLSPGFLTAMASVDLDVPMQRVSFRLAQGKVLEIDRRVIVARSGYFRNMLTSGLAEGQTNEVDLSADAEVDEASMAVLLHFVMSDEWIGAEGDIDLALRVRSLADRYMLSRLVCLAEGHLLRMLSPESVLSVLSRVVDSGGMLEQACWQLLDSQGSEIVATRDSELNDIFQGSPQFAKRLFVWHVEAFGRRPKHRSGPY